MATNIAAQTLPGAYPTLPIGANTRDLAFSVTDPALGNETPLIDSKTVLLFRNDDVAAQTVTITSSVDTPYNRTGDITAYSIGADELAIFGPFKTVGWTVGGKLTWQTSDADIKVAVITLP